MSSWLAFVVAALSDDATTTQMGEARDCPTLTTLPGTQCGAGECSADYHLGFLHQGGPRPPPHVPARDRPRMSEDGYVISRG